MKNLLLAVIVLVLAVAIAAPVSAQSKMSISVGPDVLIPIGDLSNSNSTGFGGTARGQYDFTPQLAGGLELGYFTFSGKTVSGVSLGSFSSVPVRVFGKYYFMPDKPGARFYGMVELGFWFTSYTLPSVTVPILGTIGGGTASSTDFNYVPAVGVEFPAGKVKIDVSVRYEGVASSGSSVSAIGGRVAVNFPI